MKRCFDIQDSYYHVYNRGALKQVVFHDNKDYARFTLLLLAFQYNMHIKNIPRIIKNGTWQEVASYLEKYSRPSCERIVKITAFSLMPNHFHIALQEKQDGGISRYMHRLLSAYSQYFNKKYDTNGHVFQGSYKIKQVADEPQLYYLSAYIHNNPKELGMKPEKYSWSSMYDYVHTNRWDQYISTQTILEAHNNDPRAYCYFVQHSGAKE